jgi:hypothetical protein
MAHAIFTVGLRNKIFKIEWIDGTTISICSGVVND